MQDMTSVPTTATTTAAPATALPKVDPKSKQTAQNFEAVFLGQMTQLMMSSVDTGEDFHGGAGEDMFRGMLGDKLGAAIAQRGGIGLAPQVLNQIIKLQQGQ